MSERSEMGREGERQVTGRLASTLMKKSYQVAQVHPLVCLALLIVAGAAAIPYGKPAHLQPTVNAPHMVSAPQGLQLRQDLTLLSTMPSKPARTKSRAAVPPVPPSPTGPPNAPV